MDQGFKRYNLSVLGDGTYLADRLRVLRNYRSRVKYMNEVQGYNSRLDPLQAAILRVKLAHLDEWNARRSAIAALYHQCLVDCGLTRPHVPDWADPVWHLYVVQHPQSDALHQTLAAAGVGTLIHYPIPPHRQAAYAEAGWGVGAFPLAECMGDEVLSLLMGPHLSDEQQGRAIDAVLGFLA